MAIEDSSESIRPELMRLDAQSMRQLGYAAVDMIVDRFETEANGDVVPWEVPGSKADIALGAISSGSRDAEEVLEEVRSQVLPQCMNLMHPRFFAYIPGPSNFVSAVADFLASGFNVFAGVSTHNLGSYELEDAVVRWLCQLIGFDDAATGLFVSGGSAASLTGLLAARHRILNDDISKAVVYYSDQTHSSVGRALNIMGLQDEHMRVLPSDQRMRLDTAALKAQIAEDKHAGLRPFCVVASAGTTSSGAIDPLAKVADICEEEGIWMHVDAAYGGGAMLSKAARPQFEGIARADSVAIDPHKWLFQPFECAAVLTRHATVLHQTFRRVPDYMKDTDAGLSVPNYRDMSIQVTRAFKALKLWMSLQVFGTEAFQIAVDAGLTLARFAEGEIKRRTAFELVTPATLGVVTYRYIDDRLNERQLDELNDRLCSEISRSGFAFVSGTALLGRRVQRLCPIHPNATEHDIRETLDRITELACELIQAS